jgi:hypothetical protein
MVVPIRHDSYCSQNLMPITIPIFRINVTYQQRMHPISLLLVSLDLEQPAALV